MIDTEKVLHGLDSCGSDYGIPNICEITECPYREHKAWCVHELALEALGLIEQMMEEREPTKVKLGGNSGLCGTPWYQCSACSTDINPGDKYCRECGRPVKWNA